MNLSLPTRFIWPFAGLIVLLIVALALITYIVATRHIDRVRPAFSPDSDEVSAADALSFTLDADVQRDNASRFVATYKRLSRIAVAGLLALIVAFAALVARPAAVDEQQSITNPRDIVLCLDVSGSALAYDRQIIAAYSQLVKNMHGERIGLSIFNSTSKTVFPLTDDYDVVNNQLNYAYSLLSRVQNQDAIDAMSDKEYEQVNDWLSGTQNVENSTSLIGDGLVSCTMMLAYHSNTRVQKARNASIILATDNVPSGKQTFTLNEALNLAEKSSIHVDALYIGTDKSSDSQAAQDLEGAITRHGGTYVDLHSNDTIDDITNAIFTTKSGIKRRDDASNLIDVPAWIVCAGVLAFFIYVVAAERIKR